MVNALKKTIMSYKMLSGNRSFVVSGALPHASYYTQEVQDK